MYRKTLFSALLFILSASLHAQDFSVAVNYATTDSKNDPSFIFYDGITKLTWDDFKAAPCNNCVASALTSSGFGFQYQFDYTTGQNPVLTVVVTCKFDKNASWVKADGKTDYILKHEQHHFDISYICTMHFIEKLKTADLNTSNYKQVIRQLYQESLTEMKNMQDQYDDETQHGLIKEKQQEWGDKIDAELKELKSH